MKTLLAYIVARVQALAVWLALAVVILGALGFALRPRGHDESHEDPEQRLFVDVKRVLSGQKVKLEVDKPEDEYLVYAGIRAPIKEEPLFEESTKRNAELVERREVRIRFDDEHRNKEGHLSAYVFSGEEFVNETLVREGLAYARITGSSDRFGKRLLAAQGEARKAKRGLWGKRTASRESSFRADPKYGNYHRASCEDIAKTPGDRVVMLKSEKEAFDRGFAPCSKCKP